MADVDAKQVRDEGGALIAQLAARWNHLPVEAQDTIAQAFLTVLGSGPTMAHLSGVMAANAANGAMYHNAVQNQQKINLLGMATTATTIRDMLGPTDLPDPENLHDR